MIEVALKDAQKDLPALAEKALTGEEVFIRVGEQRLRLSPMAVARPNGGSKRWGQGSWKGRLVIPDAFYEPYTDEEIGEGKG
jgi:hypothetical protein